MTTAVDLSVRLGERPGSMAAALEALDRSGVTVEAVCGFVEAGVDVDHFLVEDPVAASVALESTGALVLREREVSSSRHPARGSRSPPWHVASRTRGVGVDVVYVTLGDRLVIGCDDLERARAAL